MTRRAQTTRTWLFLSRHPCLRSPSDLTCHIQKRPSPSLVHAASSSGMYISGTPGGRPRSSTDSPSSSKLGRRLQLLARRDLANQPLLLCFFAFMKGCPAFGVLSATDIALWNRDAGTILIDGIEIESLPLDKLRSTFG
mmetsp:Transcript_52665/g.138458  ORF Transcript_52665/g.138458 Transcript_52665/m.138458 type:complete len:139 (-) Transcript_52665:524-940(-)